MVKNRIFVTINCTLHILDFYIPLTRIKIFSKPISNILRFKNIIFLFSKEEQIGLTIDIWTLKSLKSLKKVSEKFSLFETSVAIRKNFILFFTIEGILEIWNIETLKKICSLNLKLIFNSKNFFFIDFFWAPGNHIFDYLAHVASRWLGVSCWGWALSGPISSPI